MSKIQRAFQKIFADGITPTGNILEFGSLAEGSPTYTKDPALIQSRPAWLLGWASATIGNQSPSFQDFNAYMYLISRQIAYLLQSGTAEWDTNTVYYIGSLCQVAGILYRSKTDSNQGNAVADTSNWEVLLSAVATSGAYGDLTGRPSLAPVATSGAYSDLSGRPSLAAVATSGAYSDLSGRPSLAAVATTGSYNDLSGKPFTTLARAWVNFNGSGGVGPQVINDQINVSSVEKISTGRYTITFASAMANISYCIVGSGFLVAGQPASVSDDNTLKTTTQINVQFTGAAGPGDCITGNFIVFSI